MGVKTIRSTARAQVARLIEDQESPLDFVVGLAGDRSVSTTVRLEACRICLPYIHPRLSAMASIVTRVDARDPQALLDKLQAALRAPSISSESATIEGELAEAEPVAA